MSALPRFFSITAVAGLLLWLTDAPYPFPLLAMVIVGASAGGLLLSLSYVHAFMPYEWARMITPVRRLFGFVDAPVRHTHE